MSLTLVEALSKVAMSLVSTGIPTYRAKVPVSYDSDVIVWFENDEAEIMSGNGNRILRTMHGYVHLWTTDERYTQMRKVEKALAKGGIKYSLMAVQWDEDVDLWHYTWHFVTKPCEA